MLHELHAHALPLILIGDLNARTRTLNARPSRPPRSSLDTMSSAEGLALLTSLGQLDLSVLNGAVGRDCGVGRITSHQAQGQAVVDDAIVSSSPLPSVRDILVRPHRGTSDYSAL